MQTELSVIIVNYNGLPYLKDCLDSLIRKLYGIPNEIILIDNNSQDESCAFLKDNYPDVVLIESKVNLGFGKGNNEAVKQAKSDTILLINNDTIVLDDLKPVLDFLKNDASIGVVGINMLNAQRKYLPVAGVFPNYRNMFLMKKLLAVNTEFTKGIFSEPSYEVDWLSGSFLLLRKETYQKINGFDEDYFLYVEDVDFCKRISNLGLKRIFLPNYNYIHFVGFNTSKNPLLVKGYKIYISKHFKGVSKLLVSVALQFNSFVKNVKLRTGLNQLFLGMF
ncbi:glycosyltransferase family 2 protein [Flavobacterium silvaticum]|uniref:Glycosyltransferase family 2 protein n=1 Tax=Flavobacterium silvaticum TaxID=1852020 RepID=A0A972FVI6_9FLAO|nr:glycosyltransferase family 2 protein [Flavobacterium silvaticum]NMH28385.1 glycosyltransferase family 2 protein [Flavobacterium silvaticum]